MGVWRFVKRLFGLGEKKDRVHRAPTASAPPYVRYKGSRTHWKKLKDDLDEKLEQERIKRSKYGG